MTVFFFQIFLAIFIGSFWPIGSNSARAENSLPCIIREYRVAKGDSLSSVGKKLNVSVNTLKLLNNINNPKVRIGTKLRFPTFSPPIVIDSQELIFKTYRIYTANSMLFLCGVTIESDKQEVYLLKKRDNCWQLIEKIECSGLPILAFELQMYVSDIDQDHYDECYILRAYGCSAKDVCFEGFYHVPLESEHLYGISINTYLFNQDKLINNKQKISVYYSDGERASDHALDRYKTYLFKRLDELFNKYLPPRQYLIYNSPLKG
jgi:LysM repeat protein